MVFYQQRFKDPFVGFDLPLQFFVLFGTQPWLSVIWNQILNIDRGAVGAQHRPAQAALLKIDDVARRREDRKSTRLNSSHQIISYAVFCLKKKKSTSNEDGVSRRDEA